jgi:ATP-binding cassette subfamily B protein
MFQWFENLTDAFPVKNPVQPPNNFYQFCRYYTLGFETPLIVLSVLNAFIAVGEVTLISYIGELVDILSSQERATFWKQQSYTLFWMAGLVIIIMPILAFLRAMILHQSISSNYSMSIRYQTHRYLLKQSISFFQRDFSGRISTKVMQNADSIHETVMKLVDVAIYISVYFIAMIIMIGDADKTLMIPVLIWLGFYIAILYFFLPKLKCISTRKADSKSTMAGIIVDTYSNITAVKLFTQSEREANYAKKSMLSFLNSSYTQKRTITCLILSIDSINYLLLFSITTLSLFFWLDSAVTIGVIAISISIALRLQGMSKWIMSEIRTLFECVGTVIDCMNTIAQSAEIKDSNNASTLEITNGGINFNAICFSYTKNFNIFNELSLSIKPGEKLGIVGRSGSGKTTLVNLLLRFYNLKRGSISIDGQDITEITQESLRHHIGMITQDTTLLHRSILDNILFGNPNASFKEVERACIEAQAHDFILSLKDEDGREGYNAQVGERGVKLSGGQRQRIAIARVLLKNPPILIMDEATSALDSETELVIQDNFQRLMIGKTVIAIAHRLSTISAMDRLIIMDKGCIVEQGSHEYLLEKGGIYAQLWAHQSGGFIWPVENQSLAI